jgi:hypothetical protein
MISFVESVLIQLFTFYTVKDAKMIDFLRDFLQESFVMTFRARTSTSTASKSFLLVLVVFIPEISSLKHRQSDKVYKTIVASSRNKGGAITIFE